MSAPTKDTLKPNSLTRELWQIAGTGDLTRLDQLLQEGADVNAGDATGVTALMRAAYHGQLEMLRALIEHGADPNARDGGGLTALSMARHAGHQDLVEALLSLGAETKTKNTNQLRVAESVTGQTVADNDIDYDDIPDPTPQVRTLHEPPDIWDLVHTTQPEPDSPSRVTTRSSFTKPLVLAGAVIVCAALAFGWFYFAGAQTDPPAASEHPVETVATEPKSSTRQRSATELRKQQPQRINPPANNSLKLIPVARVTSERVQAAAPVAAPVGLSRGKPAPKVQSKTAKSSSRLHADEKEAARRPARSERQTENSALVKKDSVKTQPVANPPATVIPKPKVIQWP